MSVQPTDAQLAAVHDNRRVLTCRPTDFDALVALECRLLKLRGYIEFRDDHNRLQRIGIQDPAKLAARAAGKKPQAAST